ncbi:hypothetical protein KC19_6G146900 [Ceratodon purpureus]|uniref:EF-hand domain-containing protein n=1 Tax=Ceratodon purpureus TaxID=3225 RepID=A0A8T0HI90_CERPU|nr:hypothetical protein KC19_6G146900 [Ceratodon purpureus]KAG0570240.1 hypothetical protein KC19_6G146900 [Ceratodon purpureus]
MASLTVDSLGCSKLQGLGRCSYDGSYRQRPMKIVAATKSSAAPKSEKPSSKQAGNSVAMETVAKRAPVTAERPVSHKDLPLENPQLPRALAAVDAQHPEGTVGRKHNDYTVLQQHCAYFDRDGDGVIFPHETYEGFKALGYPPFVSALAGVVINGVFSYPTYDGWLFDPRLPIYLEKIHRTKHGSDSEVYDTEGRFLPSKFEEIFNKYANTKPNAMTYPEIIRMTDCVRNVNDPFGWAAAKLEWGFTYWLVKDEEGFASKEAIRGIYDGSFFDWIEEEIKKGQNKYLKEVELRRVNPNAKRY